MKTIIEAGHYYSVNGPSIASLKGWELGKELASELPDAELALFIDDYHTEQIFLEPGDSFLNDADAEAAAATMKQEASHVFYETAIAQGASIKAQELLEDDKVKAKRGSVSLQGIKLGTMFDHKFETFKPTCVFLDYLLLGEKAELGPEQITILPDTYQKQQDQLRAILGRLTVPNLASYVPRHFSLNEETQL